MSKTSDWRHVLSMVTSTTVNKGGLGSQSRQGSKANVDRSRVNSSYVRRDTRLVENRVGQELRVHNGRSWVPVRVTADMIGFRAGEFVPTSVMPFVAPVGSKPNSASSKSTNAMRGASDERKGSAKGKVKGKR